MRIFQSYTTNSQPVTTTYKLSINHNFNNFVGFLKGLFVYN